MDDIAHRDASYICGVLTVPPGQNTSSYISPIWGRQHTKSCLDCFVVFFRSLLSFVSSTRALGTASIPLFH